MNEHNQSSEFLSIYNELDKYMREKLNADDSATHADLIVQMGKKYAGFRNNETDLKLYAKLRNAIVHSPFDKRIDPIAEPHPEIVQKYRAIKTDAIHPPLALEKLATREGNLRTATLQDNALSVMKMMYDNNYSNVPILEFDKVVGIFSENTFFSYIVKQSEVIFDDTMKIEDFNEIIQLDYNKSETFLFKSRKANVYDIADIFNSEFKSHKRVAAIFVTETGKQSESLLGMITPWDMLGYSRN